MSTPHLSQIQLIKKYGLKIQGHIGQHLLIDENIQKKIVDVLNPGENETILEIGPGLGALSREILMRGAKLIVIEKDENFLKVMGEEIAAFFPSRIQLIHADILKIDWKWLALQIHQMLGVRSSSSRGDAKTKIKVISNLPYYITAPILFDLIEHKHLFSDAVLMMQKEVAMRLVAQPGSKEYGRLTLGVRYAAETRHAFDVSKGCFTPQPLVDSSVMLLHFHEKRQLPKDLKETFFAHLIQAAFAHRRKMLLPALAHESSLGVSRIALENIFTELGLDYKVRAEQLFLKDFIALALALQKV